MDEFINDLKALFDEPLEAALDLNTEFRSLPGWDSLVDLSLIVLASDKYGTSIDGDVIRNARTVGDLFNAIVRK